MKGFFQMDERGERLNGQVSFCILMLTQAALALLIAYQRYVQGLDTSYYQGFNIILATSMLSYWAARLYLSGILPVISLRTMLGIYVLLVATISIPSAIIHGLPTLQNWQNTLLPAAAGPAAIIALYWIIAYLGKRRLDRSIEL